MEIFLQPLLPFVNAHRFIRGLVGYSARDFHAQNVFSLLSAVAGANRNRLIDFQRSTTKRLWVVPYNLFVEEHDKLFFHQVRDLHFAHEMNNQIISIVGLHQKLFEVHLKMVCLCILVCDLWRKFWKCGAWGSHQKCRWQHLMQFKNGICVSSCRCEAHWIRFYWYITRIVWLNLIWKMSVRSLCHTEAKHCMLQLRNHAMPCRSRFGFVRLLSSAAVVVIVCVCFVYSSEICSDRNSRYR